MLKAHPSVTALIVIDVQRAFDLWEAAGKRRNNPHAVSRIADLLACFRTRDAPIFHIRHQGTHPDSSFWPDGAGYAVKDEARERAGEPVIVKRVNSAFISTDLESRLQRAGITTLVICGATTNHCVETTTRMAGNLGFDACLVRDATWTFARTGPDGDTHTAEDIHAMTLANLDGEFARIVTAAQAIAALRASDPPRRYRNLRRRALSCSGLIGGDRMAAAPKTTTIVSTRGQVILPKAIRQRRRWDAGARLVVEDTPDGVLSRPARYFLQSSHGRCLPRLPMPAPPRA